MPSMAVFGLQFSLILKGLRLILLTLFDRVQKSAVFPDIEGIETTHRRLELEPVRSAVFPDIEGIETGRGSQLDTAVTVCSFP